MFFGYDVLADPAMLGAFGLGFMFLLIALHVPIGVAMSLSGLVMFGAIRSWEGGFSLFATEVSSKVADMELAVVPLFLLMGGLAGTAGLATDLYRLAYALIGHRRGGLAMATIGGCAGFGAVCGSSIATTALMARIALPEMLARNYSKQLSTGSIAAGGTLGMLIPPSIIFVLYGIMTEQFVLTLFVAAVVPGLIAVLFHLITIAIVVRADPSSGPAGDRVSWRERLQALIDSWAVILLAVVVGGGVYSGIFTVTESAAIGAVFSLGLAVFRGRLSREAFFQTLIQTSSTTSMIYVVIIGASIFTYGITLSQIPEILVQSISASGLSNLMIIFLLMIMYLVLGAIFDTISAMLITLPFVFPLILEMGMDPIWWGVINIMVIEIGLITPPIGLNVFVMKTMSQGISLETIFRGIGPFLAADLMRLAILVLFPALSLWLPGMLNMAR